MNRDPYQKQNSQSLNSRWHSSSFLVYNPRFQNPWIAQDVATFSKGSADLDLWLSFEEHLYPSCYQKNPLNFNELMATGGHHPAEINHILRYWGALV